MIVVTSWHDIRHPLQDANIDLFIRTPSFTRNSGSLLITGATARDGGRGTRAAVVRIPGRLLTTATIRLLTVPSLQTTTTYWNDTCQERRQSQ